jgi:RNA recognition motif-containing protein
MASSDVEYRCFVGGLAWGTDSDALAKAFSSYGEITDSKVRFVAGFASDLSRF